MWPWFARWTLHTKTLGRIAEIILGESVIFWGNLCEKSCFLNDVFGIKLFWSFALIHRLQFSSCNTRSNIEIAFRLTSVIHYAWWRNTRVSSSSLIDDDMFVKCEIPRLERTSRNWTPWERWSARCHGFRHGFRHVLYLGTGGTFLSLEMMFVCWYPQTYASTVPKLVVFHAQFLSYSRTSCIGEPFKFGQI